MIIGSVGNRGMPGGRGGYLPSAAARGSAGLAADRLHRFLRVFAGRGDLGLHQRGFPDVRSGEGPELGSFTHWIMNALISWSFPVIAANSKAAPFVFFSAMMVLQLITVVMFYPETRGITLEDMERKLGNGKA